MGMNPPGGLHSLEWRGKYSEFHGNCNPEYG